MTGPSDVRLPPRDISFPRATKSLLRIFVPVVVIVAGFILALNHHSSGVMAATVAVGAVILITGVEMPLIFRAQDRRQMRLTQDLRPDTFFVGRVSMYPYDGPGLPKAGTILFKDAGVSFHPKRAGSQELELPWHAIGRITLRPEKGKVGVGRLVLRLNDGDVRAFSATRYGAMARALADHQ